MVAAGEAGGILDTILQRLATYIEKAARLKAQVKSAMIYPVTVIAIAMMVVYIILWKVIPVFASLFESLGAELPLPTRVVVAMSQVRRPVLVADHRCVDRGRRLRHPPVLRDRHRASSTSTGSC